MTKHRALTAQTPTQRKKISDLTTIFPAELESKEKQWSRVLTDHCGQSYSIPVTKDKSLRITTLNLMTGGPYGYTFNANQNEYKNETELEMARQGKRESDFEAYRRILRITKALKEDSETAIFLFQEVCHTLTASFPERKINVLDLLKKELGRDWEASTNEDGLVTFYNTKKVTLADENIKAIKGEDRSLQTLFKVNGSEKHVNVVNIHKKFKPNTEEYVRRAEDYIRSFASEEKQLTVVAGDFNLCLTEPAVVPTDNRTGIIPKNYRDESRSSYSCTDGCFVYDPTIDEDFRQSKAVEILSGFLDENDNPLRFERVPMHPEVVADERRIKEVKPETFREPAAVLFQKNHQLFSMGPTVADVQKHFPNSKFQLYVEPNIHLDTLIKETYFEGTQKYYMWDCKNLEAKLRFMEVDFATPTPLSHLFKSINFYAIENKKETIKSAAFDMVSAHDDLQCLLAQPEVNNQKVSEYFEKYETAENEFTRLCLNAVDPGSKLLNAAKVFCTWLKISILTALTSAVWGIAIGSCVGTGVGSFTVPILGSFAGMIAGAISGFFIGLGAGLFTGCIMGVYKAYQQHNFFEQTKAQRKQHFLEDTNAFKTALKVKRLVGQTEDEVEFKGGYYPPRAGSTVSIN